MPANIHARPEGWSVIPTPTPGNLGDITNVVTHHDSSSGGAGGFNKQTTDGYGETGEKKKVRNKRGPKRRLEPKQQQKQHAAYTPYLTNPSLARFSRAPRFAHRRLGRTLRQGRKQEALRSPAAGDAAYPPTVGTPVSSMCRLRKSPSTTFPL